MMRANVPAEPPTPNVAQTVAKAIAQFNTGLFWECHETLEALWIEDHGTLHEFYHGLIQVAAGFVHVQRRNWHGAVTLLAKGLEKLARFEPVCLGIDVQALVQAAESWRRSLDAAGPAGLVAFAERAFPQITLAAADR
jgi:predicted metal-dependent hydrolase